ncbi:BTAD domain-containing putative transcriptional regulator [Ornithinimicrobium cerasi]|uniref:DNA-binding transcriptional activator of the SARP family n=1 Tax=Ornithinimicrobium cerasi TaxID=2248773 RepID=A0A285VSF8_9MICO|nr:BTAD domain-containing putative transcriptional regulator [Ornithinimicrobium cerasi]SOC56883.1 DNA-binding transcriptional activator of the SARP family [Ornithinimicrobium cerasi]
MTGITVLGPVEVEDAGAALSPRDRVVLSVLVARLGREVSADTLAEALWGEDPPPSAAKVVQGCVARLRRRLGPRAILTGPGGYRLVVPAEDVDAGRFQRLVHRARELLAVGHADQAAYAVDEALALWRGHPLRDLEDWGPGRGEAQRLVELRLNAEELRLDALLASGRHAQVLPEATLRVREEPLREHRWAVLARAHYQSGRQAEALATLRRAREVLADELGLDPGPELAELEQAVLQQDPILDVATAGVPTAVCPWPGLASYDVEDTDAFFGRDAELAECLGRLERAGVLALVGPSGSGKSSLVRAGLAARLRHQGRPVELITPGPRPLDALSAVTARAAAGTVLVVDQCEEIFAAVVAPDVRATFLAAVAGHTAHGPVVLTLRADRLGDLSAYPDVARLAEEGLYLLKAMTTVGLREAIERPARQAGLLLEQGLVDLLVRDVEGEPGSLPLLAHALRQTWERREGATLTVEGYRASGGIRGAVAQSAEQVYETATPEQRHTLRELLLRMVQPGRDGDPVLTSLARDAVSDEEHTPLVEQLVRARLVTADTDRLELAHEALARAWPRLQSWLAEDIEGERIRHHLNATAAAWQAMGRPDSELYRGARLAAAREWRDTGTHRLGGVEVEFLDTSESAHRTSMARVEAEAGRQRRANRRLRVVVVAALVLALVAAGFGAMARLQWRDAQQAEAVATAEAARARANELSASAVAAQEQNPSLAKTLAVLAADAAPPSLQSAGALHSSYIADRSVARVSMNHFANRLTAVLHPDGARVAMTGETGYEPALALEVHDALTGDLVWEWVRPDTPGHESAFLAGAAYSPDGAVLASGVVWHPQHWLRVGGPAEDSPPPAEDLVGIHLWDGTTHAPRGVLDVGPCGGWPLAASDELVLVRTLTVPPDTPDEARSRVLDGCLWDEGVLANEVVDLDTGERRLVGTTPLGMSWTIGAALSADGSTATVHQDDGSTQYALVIDTETGAELARVDAGMPHALDPTGEHVLVVDQSSPASIWRVVAVADGTTAATFTGHSSASLYGTFGPTGATVLTSGTDNVVVEWDAGDGTELRRFTSAGSGRPSAGGDGRVVVPRSPTYGAVVLDERPPSEGWSVPSCGGSGWVDQLRVAGDHLIVGRDCGVLGSAPVHVVALGTTEVRSWEDSSWTQAFEVSPDGRFAVLQAGSWDEETERPTVGALEVREVTTGEVVLTLEGFCEHPRFDPQGAGCGSPPETPFAFDAWRVRWSPDGRWIAAADPHSEPGAGAVWDAATGALVTTFLHEGPEELESWGAPRELVFSPTSDRLVVATVGGHLVALDTATWSPVADHPLDVQNAASAGPVGYDADGSLVVVSPYRDNIPRASVLLVDAQTLETRSVWTNLAEDSLRSADISPDGTRIALGTSDGVVRVVDLVDGTLVDQASPGVGGLQGTQWVDDHDLVLLGADGDLVTVTTDPDRLLDLVRGSLTRGLTSAECAVYRVEPCLSLVDLRGGDPTVPADLQGRYAVRWSTEELGTAMTSHYEEAFGTTLDERSRAELAGLADALHGDYVLELGPSSYTLTRGPHGEEFCAGGVIRTEDRPDRLLLSADRGTWCLDFHFAEVGWDLVGDDLVLPRELFRGTPGDTALLTSKPLERITASP